MSIPENKNTSIGNYSAGKVIANVVINQYCPFIADSPQDVDLQVNDKTLSTTTDVVSQKFDYFPNVPGVRLKAKYIPYNNWLKDSDGNFGDKFDEVDSLIKSYKDTTFSQEGKDYFTWVMGSNLPSLPSKPIYSIFDQDGDKSLIMTYNEQKSGKETKGKASFTALREDFAATFKNVSSTPDNKSSQNTFRSNITSDSKFAFIQQTSAEPCDWIVSKEQPIFRGQDFYIEFRKSSSSNNLATPSSTTAFDPLNHDWYFAIDANGDYSDKPVPNNIAVTEYEKTQKGSDYVWKKTSVESGSEKYDFNYQPYIIIAFEPNGTNTKAVWAYYLIICWNAEPIFVKTATIEEKYISVRLGTYAVHGSSLLGQDKLRISFMNHLGSIIIKFSEHEKNPFVIVDSPSENTQNSNPIPAANIEDSTNPAVIALIPECTLQIIGGNIQTAFMYAPIHYDTSELTFPLPDKSSYEKQIKQPLQPFVIPKNIGPKGALGVRYGGIEPDSLTSNKKNNSFCVEDSAFYICDAYEISDEISHGITKSKYMNTNSFLKDDGRVGDNSWKLELTCLDYNSTLDPDLTKAKEKNRVFYSNVKFFAGDHTHVSNTNTVYTIPQCKTPILPNLKIKATLVPDKAWRPDPHDVTSNVISITDNWSSSDYNKCDHNMTVTFLLNKNGVNFNSSNSVYLEGLRNKAFYIKVKSGYDGANYSQLPAGNAGLYTLMTGIAYGGTITEKAGERTMQVNVKDYSDVLQNSLLFNSPFYDGVRDINAVLELLTFAKFDTKVDSGPGPASFLNTIKEQCSDGENNIQKKWQINCSSDGGRLSRGSIYALGAGYARLNGGAEYKFNDGEKILDAILRIAKKSGKVMFFDAEGVFHFENFPIDSAIYGLADPSDIHPMWFFTTATDGYGQLIFELTREISVTDVYNNIHVLSSTPNYELILGDKINSDSWTDPSSEGFLGYRKTFFQQEGVFGSDKTVYDYVTHLSKFFRPPVVYNFQTLGLPMRCFDIVSVDNQKLMIISINSTIDARENKWMSSISAEWLHGESRKDPSNPI